MSIDYGGVERMESHDLQELTDHSNRFMTASLKTIPMHGEDDHVDAISAFDPFSHDAESAVQVNTSRAATTATTAAEDDCSSDLQAGNDISVGNTLGEPDDATSKVHDVHFALLYLMSNPDELYINDIRKAASTGLDDDEDDDKPEKKQIYNMFANKDGLPLPSLIFSEDAEVVLPQAHTASQLFGVEQKEGIELEAAAGILSICELFRRFLALMPGGDHYHIIDPPGLTVMRIAGGRYRVTAAHRVVWKWMNEFLLEETPGFSSNVDKTPKIVFGDLVAMTIVDVFETDERGMLLSYCPTFDNRSVQKTTKAGEQLRKQSTLMKARLNVVAKNKTIVGANKNLLKAASRMKEIAGRMKEGIDDKLNISMNSDEGHVSASPRKGFFAKKKEADMEDAEAFERALSAVGAASINEKDIYQEELEDDRAPRTRVTGSGFDSTYEC
eukprot:CAMPEP_0116017910 /NCGR_PEP_ID=MMETSP0321-20121206/8338_1 /TAXON_ID=163516 /ORGANISM="Leptocylindrus danicus var. danicus, Strain B650" /LENGTH=442 /DNA_ID=CAMNT_0003488211 /DNA_START=80 /DNA_END=1408 /DNA_ORIENTATION=+